ncbi:DUF6783 domain-containing protein [Blautia producta]|uniref:DUF6783 domain-containing protein n=1 Tax=Blautia producta TaxID=33035 RepID=UPI0035652C0D
MCSRRSHTRKERLHSLIRNARVCLKIRSGNLYVPLCGIFDSNSVNAVRCACPIRAKSSVDCDAQHAESNFQIHSDFLII